jgi:hypothetical protein
VNNREIEGRLARVGVQIEKVALGNRAGSDLYDLASAIHELRVIVADLVGRLEY